MTKIAKGIEELIGNTPLMEIMQITKTDGEILRWGFGYRPKKTSLSTRR